MGIRCQRVMQVRIVQMSPFGETSANKARVRTRMLQEFEMPR